MSRPAVWSPDRARRTVLTALGLAQGRPDPATRRDVRHLRRVAHRLGVVQLDSVNVLARAHELPFFSRLGPHDRGRRDRWLWRSRELVETRVHEACLVPVDRWPLLTHRRAAAQPGRELEAVLAGDPGLLDRVRAQVAERGPLAVSDLHDPGQRTGPWWGDPPGRSALVHLAARGEVVVHDRGPGFTLVFDLPERVLPHEVLEAAVPSPERAEELLLLHAAAAQGLGTRAELADHHRQRAGPARAALDRLVARGELEQIRVRGWGEEPVYLHPAARTARTSRARCLISPFDPLVWHRDRTARLLGFDYRIEIYTPAARRRYGYYVLPFLLGDALVARVDLKADRGAGRLEVRGSFAEAGVDRPAVARELAAELAELAAWLALTEVAVADHGDLAAALAAAVG